MKILVTSILDLKKSQHNRPHQIVRYLSKKHDVTVLSINDWWKGKQGEDELKNYHKEFDSVFNRISYHYLTEEKISPVLQELFFKKKVRELLKEDFDVHLNYNSLITGYEISKHIKTVFDLADDLGAMIKHSPQIPPVMRPMGCYVGNYFLKKNIQASNIITVTTDTLGCSCRIPESKMRIIPNGVDTRLFRNYGSTKKELGFDIDSFIIGYVGVLREWVDLAPVFEALRNLNKNIKMIVVGKEGKYKENVALATKYGVADRVHFTGMIPYYQVPKYISAMDICLIPFKLNAISQNALPLKLFEYMACEKPVISVPIPGVERVAGDLVLYARTQEEYTEKINTLFESDELKNELGYSGRKLITEKYEWEKIINDLENELRETGLN
jgi:glycosyltransferase involved in cell wall biosynthesis